MVAERAANEKGGALVLALLLILIGTLLGISLLFAIEVEYKTSRNFSDSIEALNDTESAVQEVLWRLNLKPGPGAPPAGSHITVNNLVDYDASIDYDPLGVLTNLVDDDDDGRLDDYDELNSMRDWTVHILLTPDLPSYSAPWVVPDTDIATGPPWGGQSVEATVQPQAAWREYSTAVLNSATEADTLTVRFMLDTDTLYGDSDGDGHPEIVYYDPELATNGIDDPNTLSHLGFDGNPANDSPYNITWSDGTTTRQASGTPVLLIRATAKIRRGGKVMSQHRVEVRANRPFRRVMNKALCACESISISGGTTVDSYSSSLGDYGSGPIYQNGDVGCNGSLSSMVGNSTVNGDVDTGGSQTYTGTTSVSGNATAGSSITGGDIHGDRTPNDTPPPQPCDCDEPVADMVADAALHNDNGNVTYYPPGSGGHGTDLVLTGQQTAIFPGGTYYFTSIRVAGTEGATIQVGIDEVNNDHIVDKPPNEPVRFYVSGDINIGGGGVVNMGAPTDFLIYSSAVPHAGVTITGGSEFRGMIYAPLTDITITGCSSFKGAALGRTIANPGGGGVHRDEDLADSFLSFKPIKVITWHEVD
jgi:hypothetical protein